MGRFEPRGFSEQSRWRFIRDRRAAYLRRVGGEPDDRQAMLISEMIAAEWSARVLEAQAQAETGRTALEATRLAAEKRRLLLLYDRELAATTRGRPEPEKPGPHQIDLEEHLAELERRGGGK